MYNRHLQLLMRSILSVHASNNTFSTSSTLNNANYYEALGIQKDSTQNEIKSAYYKLSMQYHPDKNKGCEISAKKFREISQAYEVLGNYRLRRLYDKGAIRTAGPAYGSAREQYAAEPEVEDDPETKFYKSRFTKSKVANMSGRTPIYDFDEWSRAHYGQSFQRGQHEKARRDRTNAKKRDDILTAQNELLYFGMILFFCGTYAIFFTESALDTPKERPVKRAEEQSAEEKNAVKDETKSDFST